MIGVGLELRQSGALHENRFIFNVKIKMHVDSALCILVDRDTAHRAM